MSDYCIRPIRNNEIVLLQNFLYEAIFQRDEDNLLPKEVIYQPELQVFIEDFGKPDDYCFVAEWEGKVVGAVWVRILIGKVKGFGNVDDKTPEFAISIYKEYRGRGIGTALMKKMLVHLKKCGYQKASLAVQKDNYAIKMYKEVGFSTIKELEEEYLMVCELVSGSKQRYDFTIIGAGIIGSFLAHDLSKYNLKIAVLEKESDVANVATMANSAIVHAGHDPKEGTLKAKLNVRGNAMYEDICKELGVSFQRTSALVVSTSEEENVSLERLYQQAQNRKIPVNFLSREEALAKEKNLSDAVIAAIELPTTGIIYPWEVAIALMEEAMINGTELFLNHRVLEIQEHSGRESSFFTVQTGKGAFETHYIINAAGVYADEIYGMVSKKPNFRIQPRKGEYYVLDKLKEPLVERVIYPLPSEAGKGVLVVPTVHGNTLLGPNSVLTEKKEGIDNTEAALSYVRKEISKTVQNVPMDQVIRTFAGLRPSGDGGDFILEEAEDVPGFIQAAGIESPGLASAPAISEYMIEQIIKRKIPLSEKPTYQKRIPNVNLKQMSKEDRDNLVKENPAFGKIICRCEQITEGEIVDAIKRPLGAKTVKGIKKRVRPGMGRCQGGFCEPLVVAILARELGVSPMDIRLDGEGSTLLLAETKGGRL